MYIELRLVHFVVVLLITAAATAGLGAGYHLWHRPSATIASTPSTDAALAAGIQSGMRSSGLAASCRTATGRITCSWPAPGGETDLANFTRESTSTMRADLFQQAPLSSGGVRTVPIGWTTFDLSTGKMGEIHTSPVGQAVVADDAAKADVRTIIPSVESYYADNNTYAGMTLSGLQATYDQALEPTKYTLTNVSATSYCVATTGSPVWHKNGPTEPIMSGPCP